MKRNILMTTAAVCFFAAAGTARATLVEIGITAKVYNVDDPSNLLNGKIQSDDIITGIYRYDSDTADSNPLSTVGDYWYDSPPYGVCLQSNVLTFETKNGSSNFLMEVVNNHQGNYDHYEFIS